MSRGPGYPGRRRATVLVALLQLTSLQAPVPAGGAQTCLGKTNITFTKTSILSVQFESIESFGIRNLIVWMQKHFAALVMPEPSIPADLPPANDTVPFVLSLVTATNGLFAVVLVGAILAVLVPVMGLLVLMCRCVCGLCGGGSEQESKDDLGKRNTWGCMFTVLYMPLMLLLISAIFCVNHLPAAISSLQDHAKFVADNAPRILWKPLNDTDVLVNTNSDEFQTAISARLKACAIDVGVAMDQGLTSSPLLKFVNTTAQYLQAVEPLAAKLVDAVEQLKGNMSDLWQPYIHNASTELAQAETRCPGCVPAQHKKQVDDFNDALNVVSASVDQLKTLKQTIKNANLQQYAGKVGQGSAMKVMLQEKAVELTKAIGDFLDVGRELFNSTAEIFVSRTSALLQQLRTYEKIEFPAPLKDVQSSYSLGTIAIVVVMGVVCLLYTIGPLGDLDVSNGVPLASTLPEYPPSKSEVESHNVHEGGTARRYVLRRLLAVNEERGDDAADNSVWSHAFSPPLPQSLAQLANRPRRWKRAVAHRDDLRRGDSDEPGQERGTYVLPLSGDEGDLTDVERAHQVERQHGHGGSGGVGESVTEFLPLVGDVAGGRPRGPRLRRDRRVRGDVFFSEDVPAARREAEHRDAYDRDDVVLDGRVVGENQTEFFPLPVDVKSYRGRPQGHPHRNDVLFDGKESAPPLPLWEDGGVRTWATESSIAVHQRGRGDRKGESEGAVLSWRRGVPVARSQGGVVVSSGFPGNRRNRSPIVVELSKESEVMHHERRRLNVGPHWAPPSTSEQAGERFSSGGDGYVSRRFLRVGRNHSSVSLVARRIHRKLLHGRRDYRQDPVQVPPATGEAGQKDTDKSAADMIVAVLKLFTVDAIVGILNRFEGCRDTGHSLFKLLGPDLAVDVMTAFVGNSSPWLSVLEEQGAPPKFDAVDGMTADLSSLQLPAEVEVSLRGVAEQPLTPDFFGDVERDATKANMALDAVIASRDALVDWQKTSQTQAPHAQQYVTSAIAALDSITIAKRKSLSDSVQNVITVCDDMKKVMTVDQNTPLKDYLKTNVDQWPVLQQNLTSSLEAMKDMLPNIRKQINSDIATFIDHARTQVRDNIGDCRLFHKLYSRSVDAVCTQGLRRFGEFWFCVWWWCLIAVPCAITALALSTFYGRTSPHVTSRDDDGDV
ncbi:uncharacterized protein [Dermacentor albipictus]|uniref:uncharacterized protein isoform X4 n=1 Tax=Dermacentor albipictus TaxID=60249 RepID=UPI0038FBEA1C